MSITPLSSNSSGDLKYARCQPQSTNQRWARQRAHVRLSSGFLVYAVCVYLPTGATHLRPVPTAALGAALLHHPPLHRWHAELAQRRRQLPVCGLQLAPRRALERRTRAACHHRHDPVHRHCRREHRRVTGPYDTAAKAGRRSRTCAGGFLAGLPGQVAPVCGKRQQLPGKATTAVHLEDGAAYAGQAGGCWRLLPWPTQRAGHVVKKVSDR